MNVQKETKEDKLKREIYLKTLVSSLPETPGIYQYFDDKDKIIYVGKAKNLKRRVTSYFNKDHKANKTKVLVKKIRNIKYIVVNTEKDALLLENNLIKKHQPRYNVLLKDDKTYPSICVQNEFFPRVFKTRKIIKNGSSYFGPYTHLPTMYTLLDLIKKLYPIRTCKHNLSQENIKSNKFKVCLEYHIKNCLGPCEGLQTEEDYLQNIAEIKEILKGNTREISKQLKEKMERYAENLEFEKAHEYKHKLTLVENFRSKSEVVSTLIHNIDVFSIESNGEKSAYINFLHIANGAINQAYTIEYKKKLNETDSELLAMGIIEMRTRFDSNANEIVVPIPLDIDLDNVKFTIPQRGEKKKLLDLSRLNVKQYKADRLKQAEKLNPAQRNIRLLKEIQDKLKLQKLPMHIESFDNSNIQGSDPVAACIVFKQGKPSKKDYRKYNIKTVIGPDDYASMHEVVIRRYSRLEKEKQPLPDLIITDGGKGQMEIVRKALEEINLKIPIAGLAKDDKHRTSELLYGFPAQTIGMEPTSGLFKLMERIQDEVHRFAIQFHRDKRSKRQVQSELDNIPGIGPKTKEQLLKTFKSIKRIKEASEDDLITLIGHSKGTTLWKEIHNKN
ncbi:UvrABC system protein C [Bacteroides coprosuis DSM 18011]|uniref:UvrABC system protein C n=2 Tax=Bacteroides coprosuis TaxID=151276 RepID=F3ZQQ9_9BACE|nr:excinuclease ABC subunit UvrC [Bacteroides coprosuis]EGJ70567.1 UvrABC system protein C [Bacteroides coprosuis DSM 18011]